MDLLEKLQEQLPFSEKKQTAFLGYLLVNDKLFLQARDRIEPGWFIDPYSGKIYGTKRTFYDKYHRTPTLSELRESEPYALMDPKERQKHWHVMQMAIAETEHFGLDVITPELTNWLHARIYKKQLETSVALFNKGKFPDAYAINRQMVKEIYESTFENNQQATFNNYVDFFENREVERKNALTFGISAIDRLLLPNCENGGLLRGDTTVIIAPTNVGKTTSNITIARHNIKQGKHVLFLTHEGTEGDIKEKIWCALLDVDKPSLLNMYKTPEGQALMDEALQWINRFLTYVPYNRAGATVEEVEGIIRRKQDELCARNQGIGYDLIIDDYPAKLTTTQAKNGYLIKRHIDEIIYNYFVQLALEFNLHMVLNIQSNREGSKINLGQKESRLLGMEDVHESYGPMQAATNVISINRDTLAELRNRVTYYICKSRSSKKGTAVVCRSKYEHALTHSNELGCTWYHSGATMADKIDQLLEQYPNVAIPESQVAA